MHAKLMLLLILAFVNLSAMVTMFLPLELQNTLPIAWCEVINSPDTVTVSGRENMDTKLSLNRDQINDLKKIILNDQTYMFGMTKESIFVPSVIYSFHRNEKDLLLTLSFHAQQIVFQCGEQRIVIDCDPGFDDLKKFSESIIGGTE